MINHVTNCKEGFGGPPFQNNCMTSGIIARFVHIDTISEWLFIPIKFRLTLSRLVNNPSHYRTQFNRQQIGLNPAYRTGQSLRYLS